jgi:hypothetical protein
MALDPDGGREHDCDVQARSEENVMEFSSTIGILGVAALVVGAAVIGVALQLFGRAGTGYEWVATAIAAGIGGFVASEFIVGWRGWEPVYDGLALLPAVIGGVVVGLTAEAATRYLTGGSYQPSHA